MISFIPGVFCHSVMSERKGPVTLVCGSPVVTGVW